jgi:hypothetical protein
LLRKASELQTNDAAASSSRAVARSAELALAIPSDSKDLSRMWQVPGRTLYPMTHVKAHIASVSALVGVVPMLPGQWRAGPGRVRSYVVYCVGYRLLSVQLTCGSLAVTAVPFVMKHA